MEVSVVGIGLIGGSVLRALAEAGHRVVGYDLDPSTRALARTGSAQTRHGWRVAPTIGDAVSTAELVVIATPLPAVAPVLDEIGGAGFTGLVTDVVSVKGPVRALIAKHLRSAGSQLAGYVGGHPMAGRETAGFAAADPAILRDCAWVLCLDDETALVDWITVARLVTGLGARAVPTTAARHDLAVAAVSHLPHLFALVLAQFAADPLAATLAAGSFRDGTRVAASQPELIAAMCGGNAGALLARLRQAQGHLDDAQAALTGPKPIAAIRDWAESTSSLRSRWPRGWGAPTQLQASVTNLLQLGERGGWVTAVEPDGHSVTAICPID